MKFLISGTMEISPSDRKFSKTIEASSEKMALERLYAEMGSRHRLRRGKVKVLKVEEVK